MRSPARRANAPLGAGSRESLCIDAGRLLLAASVKPGYTAVVVFDDRTTLGVVRWRLATLVDRLSGLLGSQEHRSMGSPITDEEIGESFLVGASPLYRTEGL